MFEKPYVALAFAIASVIHQPSFARPVEAATAKVVATELSSPTGMAFGPDGTLFVSEWSAGRIIAIAPDGERRIISQRVAAPAGIVIASDGTLYVASYSDGTVYRLRPGGEEQIFVKGLRTPAGLYLASNGSLFIADRGLNQVLRADGRGRIAVVASGLRTPVGVVQFPDGALVVSNISGSVMEIQPNGKFRELSTRLRAPAAGMVRDGENAVLVVDYGGSEVWRVTRSGEAEVAFSGLPSPVALARRDSTNEIAVGTWGDGTARVFQAGGSK